MSDLHTFEGKKCSAASPSAALSFQDFVLISEFSELEGPLPVAVVNETVYIDLKDRNVYEHRQFADKLLEAQLQRLGLEKFDFNAFALRVVSVDRSAEYEQSIPVEYSKGADGGEEEQQQIQRLSFSIPDDTQIYFNDSESHFQAFTHHLSLFDINARGYVHPIALSYITRDNHKIISRFGELIDKFNDVAVRMKQGNYSKFLRELKCRLLNLEYTRACVMKNDTDCQVKQSTGAAKNPPLSMRAVEQAITTTELMIDTVENSIIQMKQITAEKYTNDSVNNGKAEEAAATVSKVRKKDLVGDRATEAYDTPISSIPENYIPAYVETLYPVPNFERKLRSLAQLCQEQARDEQESSEGKEECCSDRTDTDTDSPSSTHRLIRQSKITQKTAAVIPLVFSIMEQAQQQQPQSFESRTDDILSPSPPNTADDISFTSNNITIANAIKHDMYSEAITCIQRIVEHLNAANIVLNLVEEERFYTNPIESALTIGHTFMLNFNNPPLRKDEASLPSSPSYKIDSPLDAHNDMCCFDLKPNTEEEAVPISDHPMLFSPAEVWKGREDERLHGSLLSILRRFQSLIVDVIFAIMTGRTVVIEGSLQNKRMVEETVHVLSIFVPSQAYRQRAVVQWFDDDVLSINEVEKMKLIGVDKQKVDSSIYINGSCVLDVDPGNGSLNSGPIYVEGQWINQFIDRINLFATDDAYLAYLHTIFMTISLKAFIYHHLCKTDDFSVDENNSVITASSATFAESSKEFISETDSEASTLSRRWSQRLMSYLRKNEAQPQQQIPSPTEASSMKQLPSSFEEHLPKNKPQLTKADTNAIHEKSEEEYLDENQATVTLRSIQTKETVAQSDIKPRTITDVFSSDALAATTIRTAESADKSNDRAAYVSNGRNGMYTTSSSRRTSMASMNNSPTDDITAIISSDKTEEERLLTMQDLYAVLNADVLNNLDDDEKENAQTAFYLAGDSICEEGNASGQDGMSSGNLLQQPDCLTDIERRGRQFLQDELKVYGDDQTIVIYLATNIICTGPVFL